MKSWSSLVLCLVGSAGLVACGDSSSTSTDMAMSPLKICTPDEKTCLDDHTAEVCTSDGLSRLSVPCGIGQKCTSGICGADPMAPCTSFDNTCMDATTALRCSASGLGFDVVTCPTGTNCAGAGLCEGGCIVGSSLCTDSGHVATCMDGKTYTTAACDSGKLCVATGTDPYNTAACLANDCTPDPNGCDFVCGNKADPMATNQSAVLSSCVETPNGYKWVALTCPGIKTCSPNAAACSNGPGTQADCTSTCTPGDTRCLDGLTIQTCANDGTWPATGTACNANPLSASLTCFVPNGVTQAVCGDIICSKGDAGACDAQGKFHACGSDGKVVADGTACATGQCVVTDDPGFGPWRGGNCASECNTGESRCAADSGLGQTFQTCVNGLWGPATQCAANATCLDTTDANGKQGHFCGDCIPGTHQCNGLQIATCSAGGTLGAPADCTVGSCQTPPNSDAVCVAQCIPNQKLCLGSNVVVPGTGITATDSEGTCSADGKIPAATACASGEFCRRGPSSAAGQNFPGDPGNGTPLGCVVCVGGQNEFGLTDTKCGDDAGTGTGNYLTTCLANSSGWDGANNVLCANGCGAPSTDVAPPATSGQYCHGFTPFGPFGPTVVFSESGLSSFCTANPGFCPPVPPSGKYCDLGPPPGGSESCALPGGGAVSDCCIFGCTADPSPTPAVCLTP